MTLLFDTNIAIALLNKDADIEAQIMGKVFFLGSIVLGELYYGAQKSARLKENLAKIETIATKNRVLDCTKQTAIEYGLIKQSLETKGKLIPDNDIWIAALAKEHNLTLVTRDDHFNRVDGLLIVKW